MSQNYEIDLVLRDAAKFLLGIVAGHTPDRKEAHRLAIALAWEAGEADQMERALENLTQKRKGAKTGN